MLNSEERMLYNVERPHTFSSMVGQEHIVDNIRNQSKENKLFSVYIFAGQFGGGKTTMARITALAANCLNKDENGDPCLECANCKFILANKTTDIIEVDAAENTGVDNVRVLKEGIGYLPMNLKKKVYIIDEVHMLSKGAFNALLKVLEEPPEHVMFILCTTDLNSIPATIRSRAATYIFGQIPFKAIFVRLADVSKKHGWNISDDALTLIAKNAQGSMRNAYSLMQQVMSGSSGTVEAADVQKMLGIADQEYLFDLLKNIVLNRPTECIMQIEKAIAQGKELTSMVNDLLDIVTDMVVARSSSLDNIHDTERYKELIAGLLDKTCVEQLFQIADSLMNIRVDLRRFQSKSTVIVGIIKLTTSTISLSLMNRLEAVEKAIKDGVVMISKESQESEVQAWTDEAEENTAEDHSGFVSENIVAEEYYEVDSVANNNECANEVEAPVEATDSEQYMEDGQDGSGADMSEDEYNDFFSLLETFNMASNFNEPCMPTATENKTEEPSLSVENQAKKKRLEERLRLVSEKDGVFEAALQGCLKTLRSGQLVLITPLRPVYEIISKYLTVTEVRDIIVEFDATASLSN